MFLAIGIGLRDGPFDHWAIALGVLCSVSMFLCLTWAEEIEVELEPGAVVLGGAGGFDPDDLFYLIGPFAWAGVLDYVLAGGTVVLLPGAIAVGIWRWRASRNRVGRTDHQTRNV
jgi:hypothetical protein